MIVFGILLIIAYWLVSAFINVTVFGRYGLLREIFTPSHYELMTRLSIVFLIVVMVLYFRFVINRKRKIEDELDKEHGLIPAILDTIGVLVVVYDSVGQIVRFNRTCEETTGYSFHEVRDKYFWKIFLDPHEANLAKEALSQLSKRNFPKQYDTYWLTKAGKRLSIKWTNTVIYQKQRVPKYVVSIGIDITEHQRIQELLQETKKDYKDLMDNIGIGIAFVSPNLELVYANNQMAKWFPQKDITRRSICHNIFSKFSDKLCLNCPTCKTLNSGESHEAMMNAPEANSDAVYRVVCFPVKDNIDKVIGAIEAVEDFTAINKQEQESRHNYLAQAVINSLLRFSLENLTLETFLKCALGVILSAPWFSRLSMGAVYLIEDDPRILVMKAQNKLKEETQKLYAKSPIDKHICAQALYSGQIQFIARYAEGGGDNEVTQDERKVYAHYCIPIIYGGNILGALDIYLHEGHERDKREEEYLVAVANTLAGVMRRKKVENRLDKINKCFVNLGVNPSENIQRITALCGEVLGAANAFYKHFDHKNNTFSIIGQYNASSDGNVMEDYDSLCQETIKQGGSIYIHDLSQGLGKKRNQDLLEKKFHMYVGGAIKCRDKYTGVVCVLFKNNFNLGKEDREFLGTIYSAIGIEEERTIANQELSEAYDKLKKAQYGLVQSEKLAALGRFSSGVAHEVKNPLGIILGGIEFLERKISLSDKDVELAIRKIKESTLRADAIVRNLLKFAMPSDIKTERIRPDDLINETLALLKYRVSLINIKIIPEFSKEEIYVQVDKNQLQQVLFNIIMNAVESMPKGGRIRIRTSKAILSELFGNNPFCLIEVIDTGVGIPPDNLPKLFEPFFTTKRDKKGTGLGLSISKIIIENHKGTLLVESEENKGTAVKVILPLA